MEGGRTCNEILGKTKQKKSNNLNKLISTDVGGRRVARRVQNLYSPFILIFIHVLLDDYIKYAIDKLASKHTGFDAERAMYLL